MAVLQEYKCPACGGALEFDSKLQKVKCPYCDSEFTMEELKSIDAGLDKESASDDEQQNKAGNEWTENEESGLRSYVCQSCGGEIVGDATTAATACPFCGNPVVMMEQFSGMLKPDLVIPFKLDKNDAKAAFKKHISGKRLLPKTFKDENHVNEIKGIYVPFWLFDAHADASVTYDAETVRTWSDSDYNYTETKYYKAYRSGYTDFADIPVDGSKKMADDLMESIEPYDLSEAVDFQTAYLAGYFADKYDVTAEQSIGRVNERVKSSIEELFRDTVTGYDTVSRGDSSVSLSHSSAKYALYPVWLLNTTYQGKQYTFAMNGQTGKFVGDLPLDKAAYRRLVAIITAAGSVGIYGIAWLVHLLGIL